MKFAVIIPVRFSSSRYPGKPLIDLEGKSMIHRVWERCSAAVGDNLVYVATDDERIAKHCCAFTDNIVTTSSQCLTGTDRVAEAAKQLNIDYAINVQGDEPLIEPHDVQAVKEAFECGSWEVVNAMCLVTSEEEFRSPTIPKVVATQNGRLLYMSRSPIPGSKSGDFTRAWKQVCIYAFSRLALESFSAHSHKAPIEDQEDIEILRFLELGYEVHMVQVREGAIAIDTPEDRERVLRVLRARSG